VKRVVSEGRILILASHPDAKDFRYLRTKAFMQGRLTFISFKYDGEKEGINYIYDDHGKFTYYRNGDELVNSVGLTQNSFNIFICTLLRRDHVAAIIVISLLFVLCYLFTSQQPIPQFLEQLMLLGIGYFVGDKIQSHSEIAAPPE
jgi:hypothetical protein